MNEATVSNYINLIRILTVIVRRTGDRCLCSKRKEFHSFIKSHKNRIECARGRNVFFFFFFIICIGFCFRPKLSCIECESDPILRTFRGRLTACFVLLSFTRLTVQVRRNSNFSHVIKLLVFLSNSPVWYIFLFFSLLPNTAEFLCVCVYSFFSVIFNCFFWCEKNVNKRNGQPL